MKPKDLKSSNDELKATPENTGAANTPELNQEKEVDKTSDKVDEKVEKKESTKVKTEKKEVPDEKKIAVEIDEKTDAESEEVIEDQKGEELESELTEKMDEESNEISEEAEGKTIVEPDEEKVAVEEEIIEPIVEDKKEEEASPMEVEAKQDIEEFPEKEDEKIAETVSPVADETEDISNIVVEAATVDKEPEEVEKPVAKAMEVEEEAGESEVEVTTDKEVVEEHTQSEETTKVEAEEPVADAEKEEKTLEEVVKAPAEDKATEDTKIAKEPQRAPIDYSELTEVEMINVLRDLLENHADEDIKNEIDSIKVNFYKKHHALIEEEKKKFLDDGGVEEDFESSNALYEDDLRNLLKDYRQLKNKHHRQMEDEKEENLQRKYEIIEEIRNLVNRKESINKTFQEFRDLQQEWREIGLVPQSKLKDLWETYHHHVENFYDYIKINRELRDLDLKKNLEVKINLCEKAEELLMESSIIKAFNILQKYHEQWREIGPVPRDKKEELWERFKAATSKINKKHQGYFESRKQDQKKNLEAKTALCEKAEEIATEEIDNHKDWDKKSRELIELQKVWRTIGFAPKKDNNRIYERFRSACDQFFDAKREFYAQNKELQQNNLQMKTDLCVQAEVLKDSTDWKKATEEFIRIQKKWKEIGPVPRKFSDSIWKRFRAACDYFFENKSKHFHHVDEEQIENLKLKKDLIKEVQNYKLTKDEDVDLQQIKEFQRRWTDIGHVPFRDKDIIQNDFRDAINEHFDKLKIDDQKRNLLKFKTKIGNLSGTSRGSNKMRFERDKYVSKLKQMESDLILLNNNVGFFANTKNAESLIDDVNKKIEDTREKIEFLKEKINIIDSMDDED